MQLGRGETIADTARVLSRYVDAIMLRTGPHERLIELADNAAIPVINGLTDRSHPCQVMADVLTYEEHRGPIEGRTLAWVGDANNVAASWMHAAVRFGFALRIACPRELPPDPAILTWVEEQGGTVTVTSDPKEAVRGADAVLTDVWVSMGMEDGEQREALLQPYQVNSALMALAAPEAVFLHCLPAHRGSEVTADVIDGPQSVVFDEVENRLHAQKAILAWCFES
jgi:ornithine carbamoyltransferase